MFFKISEKYQYPITNLLRRLAIVLSPVQIALAI